MGYGQLVDLCDMARSRSHTHTPFAVDIFFLGDEGEMETTKSRVYVVAEFGSGMWFMDDSFMCATWLVHGGVASKLPTWFCDVVCES